MTRNEQRPLHKASLAERLVRLRDERGIDEDEIARLGSGLGLDPARADKMIENCIGVFGLPVGIGTDVLVNGRDYLVPMVVEEPSVVAAMSRSAKLVKTAGGFEADADPAIMIGQLQLLDVPDLERGASRIREARGTILALANRCHPNLQRRGAGAMDLEVRIFVEPRPMLVVHLLVDCVDAMGANAVNTMVESIAGAVAELAGARPLLRILSNLADRRLARARCRIPSALLSSPGFPGDEVVDRIAEACDFAVVDPYRAATHNKGAMNGIDAVAIATGNDWRSVEAGAHAYAARSGSYTSLTRWVRDGDALAGSIELPMAVGTVGGSTAAHPVALTLRKILGIDSANELACVMASVGLAQNLGAIRALATDGIQRGHMRLHARSVALAAGARESEVDAIAQAMVRTGQIRLDSARALLEGRAEP